MPEMRKTEQQKLVEGQFVFLNWTFESDDYVHVGKDGYGVIFHVDRSIAQGWFTATTKGRRISLAQVLVLAI
jgi:hypothetical protein